jgi:hypothetical protein
MDHGEKRKFTRIPFRTEVRITAGDKEVVSNVLRDISLGGAYVQVNEPLSEGASCVLEIDLIGQASLLRIRVEGRVVRSDGSGIAVVFMAIDLDSLVHLRHLIKIHSLDPDTVEQEFSEGLLEIRLPQQEKD